jgi:hypothetical protein
MPELGNVANERPPKGAQGAKTAKRHCQVAKLQIDIAKWLTWQCHYQACILGISQFAGAQAQLDKPALVGQVSNLPKGQGKLQTYPTRNRYFCKRLEVTHLYLCSSTSA